MNTRRRRLARFRRAARTPITVTPHPTWPELRITGRPSALRAMARDLAIRVDAPPRGRPAIITISWAMGHLRSFALMRERARQVRAWTEGSAGR